MNRLLTALATLAFCATSAVAAPEAPLKATLDVELDPIAYALAGHSVHSGVRFGAWRVDLGAFGLDVPEALHGQAGFEQSFSGFGIKLDYRPFTGLRGLFFGLQLNLVREAVRHVESNITATQRVLMGGPRVGYQIDLGAGFYLTPWVGLEVALTERAQTIAGAPFEPGRIVPFPTVHLGYVL